MSSDQPAPPGRNPDPRGEPSDAPPRDHVHDFDRSDGTRDQGHSMRTDDWGPPVDHGHGTGDVSGHSLGGDYSGGGKAGGMRGITDDQRGGSGAPADGGRMQDDFRLDGGYGGDRYLGEGGQSGAQSGSTARGPVSGS